MKNKVTFWAYRDIMGKGCENIVTTEFETISDAIEFAEGVDENTFYKMQIETHIGADHHIFSRKQHQFISSLNINSDEWWFRLGRQKYTDTPHYKIALEKRAEISKLANGFFTPRRGTYKAEIMAVKSFLGNGEPERDVILPDEISVLCAWRGINK